MFHLGEFWPDEITFSLYQRHLSLSAQHVMVPDGQLAEGRSLMLREGLERPYLKLCRRDPNLDAQRFQGPFSADQFEISLQSGTAHAELGTF